MSNKLDSEELLFQSFRHSQGNIQAQLNIFHYMELQYGITTDLHPSPETWERFTKYIDGVHSTQKHQHLRLDGYDKRGASKEVYAAFKDIRKYRNSKMGKAVRRRDAESTTNYLLWDILNSEVSILGYGKPWASYMDGNESQRPARQERRVCAGRASYLLHHGRDKQPSGFAEFDNMYSDMWDAAMRVDSEEWLELIENHNDAVALAEAKYLGRLALARPTFDYFL